MLTETEKLLSANENEKHNSGSAYSALLNVKEEIWVCVSHLYGFHNENLVWVITLELHNRFSLLCARDSEEGGRAAARHVKNKRSSDMGSIVERLLDLRTWQLQIYASHSCMPRLKWPRVPTLKVLHESTRTISSDFKQQLNVYIMIINHGQVVLSNEQGFILWLWIWMRVFLSSGYFDSPYVTCRIISASSAKPSWLYHTIYCCTNPKGGLDETLCSFFHLFFNEWITKKDKRNNLSNLITKNKTKHHTPCIPLGLNLTVMAIFTSQLYHAVSECLTGREKQGPCVQLRR